MKNTPSGISISGDDIVAILSAFKLVDLFPIDTEEQAAFNRICCKSASAKLLSHEQVFSANELRMLSAAVNCAYQYLSGHLPELQVSPKLRADLIPHLFTYNRLSEYFERLIEQHNLR